MHHLSSFIDHWWFVTVDLFNEKHLSVKCDKLIICSHNPSNSQQTSSVFLTRVGKYSKCWVFQTSSWCLFYILVWKLAIFQIQWNFTIKSDHAKGDFLSEVHCMYVCTWRLLRTDSCGLISEGAFNSGVLKARYHCILLPIAVFHYLLAGDTIKRTHFILDICVQVGLSTNKATQYKVTHSSVKNIRNVIQLFLCYSVHNQLWN